MTMSQKYSSSCLSPPVNLAPAWFGIILHFLIPAPVGQASSLPDRINSPSRQDCRRICPPQLFYIISEAEATV